jgi:hypothetical protein
MNSIAPRDLATRFYQSFGAGDIDAVGRLVSDTPELVTGPLGGRFKTRTALPGAAAFATVSAGYGRLYVPAGSLLVALGPAG